MPQVPGVKVWVKKADLAKIVKLMDDDHPPQRMARAIDFAKANVARCKQARTLVPTVYSFIIKQWFNFHFEEGRGK